MHDDIAWLPAEAVILAARLAVSETGEPFEILDQHKLESAIERPRQAAHFEGVTDVVTLAVKYIAAVASAHAFLQGNKRAAVDAGYMFLRQNGFTFTDAFNKIGAPVVLALVTKQITEEECRDILADYVEEIAPTYIDVIDPVHAAWTRAGMYSNAQIEGYLDATSLSDMLYMTGGATMIGSAPSILSELPVLGSISKEVKSKLNQGVIKRIRGRRRFRRNDEDE